jgi:hypothetical protein
MDAAAIGPAENPGGGDREPEAAVLPEARVGGDSSLDGRLMTSRPEETEQLRVRVSQGASAAPGATLSGTP